MWQTPWHAGCGARSLDATSRSAVRRSGGSARVARAWAGKWRTAQQRQAAGRDPHLPRLPNLLRLYLGSMRPVEPQHPRPGNPGASHSRNGGQTAAGATVVSERHGPADPGGIADTDWRLHAAQPHGNDANTNGRNRGCRGHSGCTTPLVRDTLRREKDGQDDPCAHPGFTEGAGRTRPGAPHSHGTAFNGTVSGAARSSSLPARGRPLPRPPASALPVCTGCAGTNVSPPQSPLTAGPQPTGIAK